MLIDRQRLLRRGMDQISAWLPALLMMVFALATWWLVRSAPVIVPPAAGQRPASPDPDYFMRDFSVRVFDPDGSMRSELQGIEGRHFPADDTLEVTQPRMRSYDEDGHPTVSTALRGLSNADGSEIRLYGDARVLRDPITLNSGHATPRLEFRGQFLHALVKLDRVDSDQPVTLLRGDDVFTGDRFDYDRKSGIAHLTGRVRGTLAPRTGAAS